MTESSALRTAHPSKVATRLDDLGLRQAWLVGPVKKGVVAAQACTKNDPPQLPGILGWGKITRELRDLLIPVAGWKRCNVGGQASTVHPSGLVAIVVAAGNERTGVDSDQSPATRSIKGLATELAIESNERSFAEYAPDFKQFEAHPAEKLTAKQTWLLLYYIDEEASTIRCELSLPSSRDRDGFVSEWRERILLPQIDLPESNLVTDEDHVDDEIDVDIQRKTG